MIPIIYQNSDYIVIQKPSGLLVHRSPIDKHETEFLVQQLRDQVQQKVYTIHRLDKPTSGIMVFGLNLESSQYIGQQFEEHSVKKTYTALVRGHAPESGFIDYELKEKAVFKSQNAEKLATQSAVTEFELIEKYEVHFAVDRYPTSRYSLLKLSPTTGRRHQLRRHMKHISHPIIGDTSYGKTTHNQFFRDQLQSSRLMLHAHTLSFQAPNSENKHFEAPLPASFVSVIEQLKNFCSN